MGLEVRRRAAEFAEAAVGYVQAFRWQKGGRVLPLTVRKYFRKYDTNADGVLKPMLQAESGTGCEVGGARASLPRPACQRRAQSEIDRWQSRKALGLTSRKRPET